MVSGIARAAPCSYQVWYADVAASGTVKKVIEINPYLLGTMAGGAADCQYWCVCDEVAAPQQRHFC
jgi:20S proteasome alpha/beta subunit